MKGWGIKMQGYMKTLEQMCNGTHGAKDKAREIQGLGHSIGNLQRKNKGKCTEERASTSAEDRRNAETCTRGLTRENLKHACSEMIPNRTFLAPLTDGTL